MSDGLLLSDSVLNDPDLTDLQRAIVAVDRLNSWVRSPSYTGGRGGGRKAVYWLKRCALLAASAAYENPQIQVPFGERVSIHHRLVATIVTCRDCGGSGKYVDQYDWDHGACRDCVSSGQVILYFIVSDITIGWVTQISWHTPADTFPLPRSPWLPSRTTWTPNQAGKDLTPSEVAEALNIAETFFTDRPGKRWIGGSSHYGGGAYVDDFDYKLALGSTAPECCYLCGCAIAEPGRGFIVSDSCFLWRACVCEMCDTRAGKTLGAPSTIFQRLKEVGPPAELIENEHIRAWIDRRHAEEAIRRQVLLGGSTH